MIDNKLDIFVYSRETPHARELNKNMTNKECTVFMLSGSKCKYVPEREIVNKIVCTFIYDMHAMRMTATECIACT